jgi:hypothetical protein
MILSRRALVAPLLVGVFACAGHRPEAAVAPPYADSARGRTDTIRGRESGSAGYVVPPPIDPHHGPRRFYTGKEYGSESVFNPLTHVLNEGFDVLSISSADRHVLTKPYGTDFGNVVRSVAHAPDALREYGWGNVLKAEIIPTSFTRTRTSGKWISNYQLHMFGSGMVSHRMTDWYDIHGYKYPALLGQASTMAGHLLNEMSENAGDTTLNEDPVVDLMLFDVAGFVLWHQHWMQRAFSGQYTLTNWPGQPSYDPINRTLENTGQYFVLRGPLPIVKSWDFFYLFGMSGSVGVSKTIGNGHAISLGLGFDHDTPLAGDTTRSGAYLPKASIYFDRNGSLLWSAFLGNRTDATRATFNVYPGVLRYRGFTTGAWMQLPKTGGVRGGLISSIGVGLGGSSVRPTP